MSSAPSAYGSRHTTVMRCPWAAMLWLAAGASCQSTSTCVRPRGMGLDDCNALHPQRASSVLRSSACGAPITRERARGQRAAPDEAVETLHRSDAALAAARRPPAAGAPLAAGPEPAAYLIPAPDSAFWRWRAATAPGAGANATSLVWELSGKVGVGNALDALAGVVLEALRGGERLVVRSPIVAKLCALADCALVPAAGAITAGRAPRLFYDARGRPARFRGDRAFKWRFSRVPKEDAAFVAELAGATDCAANVAPTLVLSCVRSRILRDLLRGASAGLVAEHRGALRDAYVDGDASKTSFDLAFAGTSKPADVGSLPRRSTFDVGLHLRFLDFIEGGNASRRGDGPAVAWLSDCASRVGFACLARRLGALLDGCDRSRIYVAADSAPIKRAFAAALAAALPSATVSYLDVAPPHFSAWFARRSSPGDWWALLGAFADWYLLASADAQLSLKGTAGAAGGAMPSSFARSASLYAGVGRADLLADALVAELPNSRDAHVRCCSWQTYRHW